MNVCVLETDVPDHDLELRYGSYADMIRAWFGDSFQFDSFSHLDVRDGEWLNHIDTDKTDLFIITGSRFSVNDKLEWIGKLECFIRELWERRKGKLLGICFGHQIIAKALGGVVARNPKGWIAGVEQYQCDFKPTWLKQENWLMPAIHQDQVTTAPIMARTIGGNKNCLNAFLSYGNRFITVQFHPEHHISYTHELIMRKKMEPKHLDSCVRTMDLYQPDHHKLLIESINEWITYG